MMRYCYALAAADFGKIAALQVSGDVGFELRLDTLASEPDARALRALTARPLLATYRSWPHLGQADPASRAGRGWAWRQACLAAGFEAIDVELDEDGLESKIAEIQAAGARTVISHHDLGDGASLDEALDKALATQADIVKIVATGQDSACFARQRRYYRQAGQRPLIHFAMGHEFAATRVLSLVLGAPFAFIASEDGAGVAPGQLTLSEMQQTFRAHTLRLEHLRLFAVVGSPIGHSRSPRFHNPKLAALDPDSLFLALPAANGEDLATLLTTWPELRGLAVTKPLKETAFALATGFVGEYADRVGASNTLLRHGQGWQGANTDLTAVIDLLERIPQGLVIRVLGYGGLGKAVVVACLALGRQVQVSNRTSCEVPTGARWLPWAVRHSQGASVLIQATSVGMAPHAEASPLERIPTGVEFLIETIYHPEETQVMTMARAAGAEVIGGNTLFDYQAMTQSRLFARCLEAH